MENLKNDLFKSHILEDLNKIQAGIKQWKTERQDTCACDMTTGDERGDFEPTDFANDTPSTLTSTSLSNSNDLLGVGMVAQSLSYLNFR